MWGAKRRICTIKTTINRCQMTRYVKWASHKKLEHELKESFSVQFQPHSMASLQWQKPVAQQTVCQKTTTVTCHKANEHHSFADKMKEMTGKMFHHENHGQQSACHGSKTQHSAGHGSTAMHGGHANHSQQTACHGSKIQHSAGNGSATMHGNHAPQPADCMPWRQTSTIRMPWLHCYAWKSW